MTVAKYLRISDADKDMKISAKMESCSIVNQRLLISDFIREHAEFEHADVIEFCDM